MTEKCVPGTNIPKPHVELTWQNGNAFAIMGRVSRALRRNGVPQEIIKKYTDESTSGDYDHLLAVACKYADAD